MRIQNRPTWSSALFLIGAIFCVGSLDCFGQDEEKSIQSEALITKRPKPSKKANNTARIPANSKKNTLRKKRTYRLVKRTPLNGPTDSIKAMSKDGEVALLGVTIWKMRPATKNDAAKELIEEQSDGKKQDTEYTLERLESNTPLANGERIRISVESLSHGGYLYVIDREFYDDGTYSRPKLIYPTLRSKNRNTQIGAGNLLFIPEAPGYFRVKSNQAAKKQIAEVLTFLVSPTILVDESLLQLKAIELPLEQFSDWLRQWEVPMALLEENDGAGETITLAEQSAGQNYAKGLVEESSSLTQDDPIPQSVFRSQIKRGDPMLVNVFLKFRAD